MFKEIDLTETSEIQSQKQKLIDALRELDIDYELGNNSIKIKGFAAEVSDGLMIIEQYPDNKIVYEEYADANKIVLNSTGIKPGLIQVFLDKSVKARYDFPYLIVEF